MHRQVGNKNKYHATLEKFKGPFCISRRNSWRRSERSRLRSPGLRSWSGRTNRSRWKYSAREQVSRWILQNAPLWMAVQTLFSINEGVKSKNGDTAIHSCIICNLEQGSQSPFFHRPQTCHIVVEVLMYVQSFSDKSKTLLKQIPKNASFFFPVFGATVLAIPTAVLVFLLLTFWNVEKEVIKWRQWLSLFMWSLFFNKGISTNDWLLRSN